MALFTDGYKYLAAVDMYSAEKNIVKNLAVSKEVAILAMRDSDRQIVEYILNVYKKAYPCDPTFGWSLSRKQKGVRPSFCTYLTKLLIQKCETAKKLVGRGIIVPVSHPTSKGPICTAATCTRRYLYFLPTKLITRMSIGLPIPGTPSGTSLPTSDPLTPIIPC